MDNSKYVTKAHETVNRATEALAKLDAQEKTIREQLAREEIGAAAAEAKREEIAAQRRATREAATEALNKTHTAFLEALEQSQLVDASMIDADAQLLSLPGLTLTDSQFTDLVEKHRNNPLMVELLQGYQTAHPGLYCGVAVPTPEDQKAAFEDFMGAAQRVLRQPDGLFAAFFADGQIDPQV